MPELQKTINYFQFKNIPGNRAVDEKHVDRLVVQIEKDDQLELFPMIVNSTMGIIDGQHRLKAAERLKKYIYYFVSDSATGDNIGSINNLSKKWSINDFINYWSIKEIPGFDKLRTFMLANPLIPASTAIKLISVNYDENLSAVREGNINTDNFDRAVKIAGIIREYFNLPVPFAYERKFILAVLNTVKTEGYDHDEMRRQLEYQVRSVRRCISARQYTEMLQEIYNYNKRSQNHIKFKI